MAIYAKCMHEDNIYYLPLLRPNTSERLDQLLNPLSETLILRETLKRGYVCYFSPDLLGGFRSGRLPVDIGRLKVTNRLEGNFSLMELYEKATEYQ